MIRFPALCTVLAVLFSITGCTSLPTPWSAGDLDTNQALLEAKPLFISVRYFDVNVTPLENDELDPVAMTQAIQDYVLAIAERLELPLEHCDPCPPGSVTVDFRQHPQGSIKPWVTHGHGYTGTLYLVRNNSVIDEIPINVTTDQKELIATINTLVATRMVKTVSVRLVSAYQRGHISDRELAARVESVSSHLPKRLAKK